MSKKFNVENHDPKVSIKWDELIVLYEGSKTNLSNGMELLNKIGENFEDVINNDQELTKIFLGTVKSYKDLSDELAKTLSMHSKEVVSKLDNKEVKQYNPYVGEVDKNNEKHQELYIYIVMAYGGIWWS